MSDNEPKMIDVIEELRSITECSICRYAFQEPKILSCVHTFCKKCLQDFATKLTKGPGDQIPCPMCRKEFGIPEGGCAGLARNFFMERLIEIQNILEPSSENTEVCEACPDENSTTAEVYCADCQLRLCVNCHKLHTRSKLTKNHRIIALDATRGVSISTVEKMMTGFCNVHDMKPLEILCRNCMDTVCATCFVENHKGHDGASVDSVVKVFQKQIRENINSLEQYITTLEQRKVFIEQQKFEFIQNSANLEAELKGTRDEMRAYIDEHHNSIVEELNSRRRDCLKRMEMEKDEVENLLAILQSYTVYCEQVTTLGSASNICRDINSLSARAEELRSLCDTRVEGIANSCVRVQLVREKAKPSEILRCADGNLFGRLQEGIFGQEITTQNPCENVAESNCSEDTANNAQAEKSNEFECGAATGTGEVSACSMEASEAEDNSRENAADNFCTELQLECGRCRELKAANISLTNANEELRTKVQQLNGKVKDLEAEIVWFDASS